MTITLCDKRYKFKILRGGAYPGLSRDGGQGDQTDMWKRRQCDQGGRVSSDVATSQGIPTTTRSWKRQKNRLCPRVSGECVAWLTR